MQELAVSKNTVNSYLHIMGKAKKSTQYILAACTSTTGGRQNSYLLTEFYQKCNSIKAMMRRTVPSLQNKKDNNLSLQICPLRIEKTVRGT